MQSTDSCVQEAGRTILAMIPGEMAYEVWADEQDNIHISKTGDLADEADNPNIIVIKCSGW
ncbi:hypothetical protein [Mucilaginibacter sp.]|uniref:hypothetical protein n=1 Tax=Mucilaginibacter sp. TaxID=1882438 RepID=UPI00284D4D98|nr:hypothetical protein [Mucilaginibacter sp.]MDR3695535.1 hypothetical protein [Mucilaginibacter sp.]